MRKVMNLGLNTKSVRGVHPAYSAYSLYKARVEADGGYIQDELKTRDYFAATGGGTRGYVGYAGIKTSLFEGRVVVDKVYDLHGVADQEFAGLDRPELLTWQVGQASWGVEKNTTNLIPEASQTFDTGWTEISGAVVTITQGQSIDGITDDGATLIESVRGTTDSQYQLFDTGFPVTGEPVATFLVIKNTGDVLLQIYPSDSSTTGNIIDVPVGETVLVKSSTASLTSDSSRAITFRSTGDFSCIAYRPQVEKSAYVTQFTTGTRTAPAPVVDGFLPDTGWIGGVVDVMQTSDNNWVYENTMSVGGRTSMLASSIENRLAFTFAGGSVLSINDAPVLNGFGNRAIFGYETFWDGSTYHIILFNTVGQIYKYTGAYTPSGTQVADLSIGTRADGIQPQSLYQSAIESGDDAYSDAFAIEVAKKMTKGDIRFKDAVWEIQP